ncbi:MAG: hypothetical protein JG767_790 [Deferribacteraceae bacterium]|jgi:hypothetical protein|nr:hypothetical protein [Deferribacteraceae bacterium]
MIDKLKFLPEYNPEPVMLSDKKGEVIYKNNAADKIFHYIKNICDLSLSAD